jgi:hypothetical protein
MSEMYILVGPADCGNALGVYKPGLVPAGKFAIVQDGEYANGGYGPVSVDGRLYGSKERALAALEKLI